MSEKGPDPQIPDQQGQGTSGLARSSIVMAGGTVVSRILGLVRVALLISVLGVASPSYDIWQTANTIPNTLYILMAAGVLNVVLLPQLTRGLDRGEEGRDYTDRLISLAVVVLVAGTALFLLAAPLIVKLYAVQWAWGSPTLTLAITFGYLCIPQILFYGLHTLLGQVLAAHHRFAAYMWSPALANVIAISGILLFAQLFPAADAQLRPEEWSTGMILVLGGSATLGIAVQALILIPALRRVGFRWRFRWGYRGVGLGNAKRMALWTFAGLVLAQGGLLVVSNLFARITATEPGAPARGAFDSAHLVFILPHSIITISLLTAIYPILSRAWDRDDRATLATQIVRGYNMVIAAMVPLSVGLILLAPHVLRVIYARGADPQMLAGILIPLAIGLAPWGIYLMSARVFYAREDGRTPFWFQVAVTASLLVFVVIAFFLPVDRGTQAVAVGQTVGQFAAAGLGMWWVRRVLPNIDLRAVASTAGRCLAAAVIALVPLWLVLRLGDLDSLGRTLLVGAVGGLLYLAVYGALVVLFRVKEAVELAAPLVRRVLPGVDLQRFTDHPAPTGQPSPASDDPRGTLGWTDGTEQVSRDGGEEGDMDRLEVGARLGDRYVLEELLAARDGGELQYWSARDSVLDRLVAVTVLPSAGEHRETADAVMDAARRVASVDDPRLVRVLDVSDEDGICWIIEEGLAEAVSLAGLVEDAPLPAEEVRRLVGETASGLEAARRRGLHHLYLNPHSILRAGDGAVKISGVGVASSIEGTEDVTADEASLIDTADLVSLLYTGLTGRWPGEDLPGVQGARRLADGSLPAPSELVSGVPGDLDALCRLVLSSTADLRSAPHTPGELARQLQPWSPDMVTASRPGQIAGSGAVVTGGDDEDATTVVPKPYYRTSSPAERMSDETGDVAAEIAAARDGEDEGFRPRGGIGRRAAGGAAGAARLGGRDEGYDDDHTYDDDYEDPGLAEESGVGVQNVVVAAIILGILGLAVLLGWGVVRGLGGGGDEDTVAESPSATEETGAEEGTGDGDDATGGGSEEGSGEDGSGGQAGASGVVGVTSFDPQGDGNENNADAPLVIDGDPETAWTSRSYYRPNWGGIKDGTGLVLDLGDGATVDTVTIDLGDEEVGAQLFLADEPSLSGGEELDSSDSASGTWEVDGGGASGRYLILWFTRPAETDDGYAVSVREITVD